MNGNLTDTSLEVSQIGWTKAAGIEGRFTSNVVIRPDWSVSFDSLKIAAADLWGYGSVAVSPGLAALERLEIGNLRYGKNQLSGHLVRKADESWDLSLTGRRFDIGPLAFNGAFSCLYAIEVLLV